MASRPIRDLSQYPRPWFYRPEIYYSFFIFPPAWSVLTLRSPWQSGEGFRGIMVGGIAWFIMIASVVFAVRWVQADDDGNRQIANLFIFVPGILLTLLTQVQWAAHRSRYGPPPTEEQEEKRAAASVAKETAGEPETGEGAEAGPAEEDEALPEPGPPAGYTPRRRRRRRRRPISRSADSPPLC